MPDMKDEYEKNAPCARLDYDTFQQDEGGTYDPAYSSITETPGDEVLMGWGRSVSDSLTMWLPGMLPESTFLERVPDERYDLIPVDMTPHLMIVREQHAQDSHTIDMTPYNGDDKEETEHLAIETTSDPQPASISHSFELCSRAFGKNVWVSIGPSSLDELGKGVCETPTATPAKEPASGSASPIDSAESRETTLSAAGENAHVHSFSSTFRARDFSSSDRMPGSTEYLEPSDLASVHLASEDRVCDQSSQSTEMQRENARGEGTHANIENVHTPTISTSNSKPHHKAGMGTSMNSFVMCGVTQETGAEYTNHDKFLYQPSDSNHAEFLRNFSKNQQIFDANL